MATRNERVVLSLDDQLSAGMLKAAGATRTLEQALDGLDGTHVDLDRSTRRTVDSVDDLGGAFRRGGSDIDRYSGRLGILRDVALTLGPSLIPIGAVAVPAVTGLANQLGAAGAAAGVAILAFQGVGDALTAVNDAALEPTAANLEAARMAMEQLSPAGRDLVTRLSELREPLMELRNTAQAGFFPGLIEGLDHLERLGGPVTRIVDELSTAMGDIAADAGASLAGPRWAEFFEFLGTEARGTLTDLAATVGSVAHGLSEMWMAFQPLNRDFSDWLRQVAADFDGWAQGLSNSQDFQEFVAYIRENGPRVAEAAGAIGNALVQITEALAPLGGPSLQIIESFADTIATIADSDIGTPLLAGMAALAAYNRVLAITVGLQTRLAATGGLGVVGGAAGKHAARGRGGALLAGAGGPAGLAAMIGTLGAATANQTKDNDNVVSRFMAGLAGGGDSVPFLSGIAGGITAAVADAPEEQGFSFNEFAGKLADPAQMERLTELQERASGTGRDAAEAQRQLADALGRTGDTAGLTSDDVEVLNQTIAASAAASLGAFSAETQWRAAMKAAGEQARSNNAGIKGQSEAALQNRMALESLAGSWNNLSQKTRENVGRARQARKSFIEMATAMGVPAKEARRLADRLLNIPKETRAKITAQDAASAKIRGIQRLIDKYGLTRAQARALLNDAASGKIHSVQRLVDKYGLTRAEASALLNDLASGKLRGVIGLLNAADGRVAHSSIVITTTHRNIGSPSSTDGRYTGGGVPKADGGVIPGQRSPYGDKVLAHLAPGEYVVSNRHGQADKHRALLERINANRLADGGTVSNPVRVPARSGNQRVTVDVNVGNLRGSIDSPFGPVSVEAAMRAVAREEVEGHAQWMQDQGLN